MNSGPQELVMLGAENSAVGIGAEQFVPAEGAHSEFLGGEDNARRRDLHRCLDIGVLAYERAAFVAVDSFHAAVCDSGTAGRLVAYEAGTLPEPLPFLLKTLLFQAFANFYGGRGVELLRDLLHALPRNAVPGTDLLECDSFTERLKDVAVALTQRSFTNWIFVCPWFTPEDCFHLPLSYCDGRIICKNSQGPFDLWLF
jgi:hypothetical protein